MTGGEGRQADADEVAITVTVVGGLAWGEGGLAGGQQAAGGAEGWP